MPIYKSLTERLEIQSVSYTGTGYQQGEVWKTTRVISGSITKQRGNLNYDDGQQYEDSVSFFCRYTPFVSKKGVRIVWNGNNYTIINITNVPRNQNTIIECVLSV